MSRKKTVAVGAQITIRQLAELIYDQMPLDKREGQRAMLLAMAEQMDIAHQNRKRRDDDLMQGIEQDDSIPSYKTFISEAPVGTGKSYVLLLLAFLSWYCYGNKSVISTQTKILQNQVISKDIPNFRKMLCDVSETLPCLEPERVQDWICRVIKGRSNYLCSRTVNIYKSLTQKSGDIFLKSPDGGKSVSLSYSRLLTISNQGKHITRDLDRSDTEDSIEGDPVYPLLVNSPRNCFEDKSVCPEYPKTCPYSMAMFCAGDLIVTNHAMLRQFISTPLVDENDESETMNASADENDTSETTEKTEEGTVQRHKQRKRSALLSANNYFFDEAHHLMGYQSEGEIKDKLSSADMLEAMSFPMPNKATRKLLDGSSRMREEIWHGWNDFLLYIQAEFEKQYQADKEADGCNDGFLRKTLANISEGGKRLLSYSLARILKLREISAQFGSDYAEIIRESLDIAEKLLNDTAEAASNGSISPRVLGLQVSDEGIIWSLPKQRSFDADLSAHIPECEFMSFTSGTLMIDKSPDIFVAETGLQNCGESLKVESPFSHENIIMWVPKALKQVRAKKIDGTDKTDKDGRPVFVSNGGIPVFSKGDKEHQFYKIFEKFCLDYVPPYIARGKFGGVLILCTSIARMRALRIALEPAIEEVNGNLLVQGDKPRMKLVKEFLSNKSSVLLASNSFREGFDAPGDKLTWVILDKLPFKNTGDLELQNRLQLLQDCGLIKDKRAHINNLMLFDLVQSIGRLERTSTDWGTFTILDPRFYKMVSNENYPDGAGEWDNPNNDWKAHMQKPINDILPFRFEQSSTHWIDTLIPVKNWLEIVTKLQSTAESRNSYRSILRN